MDKGGEQKKMSGAHNTVGIKRSRNAISVNEDPAISETVVQTTQQRIGPEVESRDVLSILNSSTQRHGTLPLIVGEDDMMNPTPPHNGAKKSKRPVRKLWSTSVRATEEKSSSVDLEIRTGATVVSPAAGEEYQSSEIAKLLLLTRTPDQPPAFNKREEFMKDVQQNLHQRHLSYHTLFLNGVPDIEPYDSEFLAYRSYDAPLKNDHGGVNNLIHHPMIGMDLGIASLSDSIPVKVYKTVEEKKQERHSARLAKQTAHQRAVSTGEAVEGQKMRLRNLNDILVVEYNRDPIGTETRIRVEMEARRIQHQEANYHRHIDAIPHQIVKREEDTWRLARRNPWISAYLISPITRTCDERSITTFKVFANDGKMRGFIALVCDMVAIVVLTGGDVSTRHVHSWITEKNRYASEDTKGISLFQCRLEQWDQCSFYEKTEGKKSEIGKDANPLEEQEYVYVKQFDTVKDAAGFFRKMPVKGPWSTLDFIWDAALRTINI